MIIKSFGGLIGTAFKYKIKLISAPLLQIAAPLKPVYPLITSGIIPNLLITSPLKPTILLIESPKTQPLLQIVAPKTLLISEPEYNVSVFLTEYDKGLRCLILNIINPGLLTHKALLEGIFNAVTTHESFINFGTFKSIIISAVMYKEMGDITSSGTNEYNFHHNVLISPTTTFNQYYNEVADLVNHKLEHGYSNEVIEYYKVKVWNLDSMRNAKIKLHNKGKIDFLGYPSRSYSTLIPKTNSNITITPIKVDSSISKFATMDIETMNVNGNQIPVVITTCNSKTSKIFVIDYVLLNSNLELALKGLWKQYFDYILKCKDPIIFTHNLGNFDGYFLYKGLMSCYNPEHISSIIDERNTFISISCNSFGELIEWKDSLRIFPKLSLDKLCKLFGVEGKLTPYNPNFNNLELFNNPKLLDEFINYSLQDAKSLFEALFNAQNMYFNTFKVDIESVYSLATLSLKIYRSKFQEDPIFILPSNIDNFIRNSYYGGGTDVYKAYAEKVYYYDVNSLYPYAMLNPMPYNLIKIHNNMDNI